MRYWKQYTGTSGISSCSRLAWKAEQRSDPVMTSGVMGILLLTWDGDAHTAARTLLCDDYSTNAPTGVYHSLWEMDHVVEDMNQNVPHLGNQLGTARKEAENHSCFKQTCCTNEPWHQ